MSKKLTLVFTAATFFLWAGEVSAGVVFSEVELAPIESRFIELYNDGSSSVDLSHWYIQRKTETGSEFTSLVSKTNFEGKTIAPQSYFVISRTAIANSDLLIGNLTLTESNTIQIKDPSGEVADILCWGSGCGDTSNPAEGKSIQKIGSAWVVGSPTPGASNSSSGGNSGSESGTEGEGEEDEENYSSGSPISSANSVKVISGKITTDVSVRDIAYVGIPLSFQGKVVQGGEQIYKGRYFWNFGDGDFREVKVINTDKFSHTYFYPGEYTVAFEYYTDSFAETPSASEELEIKVIDPLVSISRVGDANDFFVELANSTNYDIDLSGWLLVGSGKSFTLPKNTAIRGGNKIIIAGHTSGLTLADLPALKLATPDGKTAFEYFAYNPGMYSKSGLVKPASKSGSSGEQRTPEQDVPISSVGLGANMAYADTGTNSPGTFSSFIWPVVFLGFVGLAALAVYVIRRPKAPAGEDFELLDE